jgi:hypothetical protein
MSKYKLRKVKAHIMGGGLNHCSRIGDRSAGIFLLECGHIAVVDNVDYSCPRRRCYSCSGGELITISPLVHTALTKIVDKGLAGITWDDVAPYLRPKKKKINKPRSVAETKMYYRRMRGLIVGSEG